MTRQQTPARRRKDSFSLLPFRPSRVGSELSGVVIGADATITLPDGQVRTILAVEPVNFDCRSHAEQDALAAQFAALAGALSAGQTLQVLVESRPSDAETILPHLLFRQTPRTPALAEFVRTNQPWVARKIASAHVPDLRYYLIVSPAPPRGELGARQALHRRQRAAHLARRGLEQAVDEVCRHLKRMNLGVRRLSRADALRVIWEGLHPAEDPCPPEDAFGIGQEDDEAKPHPAQPATPAPPTRHLLPRRAIRWLEAADTALPDEQVAAWWLQRRLCDIAVDEAPDHLHVGASRARAGRLSRSLFLLAPPELTDPGWLDPIIGLDCPFRLAIHFEGLDRKAERKRLRACSRMSERPHAATCWSRRSVVMRRSKRWMDAR